MNNSDHSRNSDNVHMGVNKTGKKITKNHPSFDIQSASRPQFQPRVYNIDKNDFRNIVQQLTGSPAHHSEEPLLPTPPTKSPSMRLQRVRPSPLSPINVSRPRMMVQMPPQDGLMGLLPLHDYKSLVKTVESPVSSYMRYLQCSVNDSSQGHQSSGLLPNPPGLHPSPRTNVAVQGNGTGPDPLLPSPSGYLNLLSPRSPHSLMSSGYQHPPPLSPNYPISPIGQPGILCSGPQTPVSHGINFLLSPVSLFQVQDGVIRRKTARYRDSFSFLSLE